MTVRRRGAPLRSAFPGALTLRLVLAFKRPDRGGSTLVSRARIAARAGEWWEGVSVQLGAEEFDDFLGEMWLGVHEGAFLFEFPSGSILYTRDGTERHGPWLADDCSRCLVTWFDHGWINAYVLPEQLFRWSQPNDALLPDPADPTARVLEQQRARAILQDPEAWTNESAEGFLILLPAAHAPDHTFRQLWLDAVTQSR